MISDVEWINGTLSYLSSPESMAKVTNTIFSVLTKVLN